MNPKNRLIDKLAASQTGNPRREIAEASNTARHIDDSIDNLIGGLICKYHNEPDAEKKIKNDLQSAVFQLNFAIKCL